MPLDGDPVRPESTGAPPEVLAALGETGWLWLSGLLARVAAAEARAAAAEARGEKLEQELVAAHARIAALEEENRKLRARLGRDSSNSSKPSSSDGPSAKARKRRENQRQPSGRPPGGQAGHEGKTRSVRPPEEADRVVPHFPERCRGCGGALLGAEEGGRPIPHQQYELPPVRLLLVHHWLHRLRCPRCQVVTTATLDPAARTGQGPRLTAFIGLLGVHYHQSRALVRDLIDDLFGLRLGTGTVQACWERTASALAMPVEAIRATLERSVAAHFDETGWQQWGKRCWLWVVTTAACSLFLVHPRRGVDALQQMFPDGFEGTVHSDRWVAYNSFFELDQRQLCWSHLGRDLQAIIDAAGPAAARSKEIRQGEAAMFRWWRDFKSGSIDRSALVQGTASFRATFRAFCEGGARQDADDPWRKLGKSLLHLWPAVFRFLDHEGVEPTNNHAERIIRSGVILRKLSQGTRSDFGSVCLSRMLSVASTCRQQGVDVLDYLTEAVTCHWHGIPPPALLPPSE